jgi:hypothetical protein
MAVSSNFQQQPFNIKRQLIMAQPAYIQKTLKMKPEVTKLFDDLDRWLDYCRFNLIKFDPKDLYRSADYRRYQQEQEYLERKARREAKARQEQ